jgi:hypothetical protein
VGNCRASTSKGNQMKAAALIVKCADGQMRSVAADSLVGLRDLAKTVRNEGKIAINGDVIPVVAGVLLASWQMGPDMRFKCAKAAEVRTDVSEPVRAKGRFRK